MILNAKDRPLNKMTNSLPRVEEAMYGLFYPIRIGIINRAQIDGLTQEIVSYIDTRGVVQNMKAQDVAIKPEGQRTWKWQTLHTMIDVLLTPFSIVYIDDVKYRVMQIYDNSQYGFIGYELAGDFTC